MHQIGTTTCIIIQFQIIGVIKVIIIIIIIIKTLISVSIKAQDLS